MMIFKMSVRRTQSSEEKKTYLKSKQEEETH